MAEHQGFSLQESLKAQQGLRSAAGLAEEQFPVEAFVGMISDEIEALRTQGKSDADIAALIARYSSIRVSAEEISDHYATPEARQGVGGGH